MKRFMSFILAVGLTLGAVSLTVISASATTAGNGETVISTPEFSLDKYYRIYDVSGNALTVTLEDPTYKIQLLAPADGDKRQQWQIAADPEISGKYRIVSKYSGSALTIKKKPNIQLVAAQLDLNDPNQVWSFGMKQGKFTISIRRVGAITYTGKNVRATSVMSNLKQFVIAELSEPLWVKDWSDNFDFLDETKWNRADGHLQGDKAVVTNIGDDEHVYIDDGSLVLKTTVGEYGGYAAAAGMVDTAGKYSLSYGRVDMRAKLPHGYGTFPALWLLGNENIWPGNGEIDIMEISNNGDPDKDAFLYGTLHWSGATGNHESAGSKFFNKNRVPLSEEYHDYSLEWEHDQIRMFFDGMLYLSLNLDDDDKRFGFGDEPHFLILDNWLLGEPDGTLTPGKPYEKEYYYYIDSIKVSKREGTADYVEDPATPETVYTSTAADLVARSHDWDNEMPIALSPDGNEIAVADGLGVVYIENALTGLQKEKLTVYPMRELSAIEYSPDGTKLAVCNLIGTVLIFDTSDYYNKAPLRICNGTVCQERLLFTNDGSELIVCGFSARASHYGTKNQFDKSESEPHKIRAFDTESGALLYETDIKGEGRGTALSPDGALLAVAMNDGRLLIMDTADFTVRNDIRCGNVQLRGVSFSHSGDKIAATDEAGGIYIVSDLQSPKIATIETATKTSMTTVEFSADGTNLLVNSSDNCARLYDAEMGTLSALLGGFSGMARHAKFSPNGERIAVGAYDGTIKIYDALGNYKRTLITSETENNGQVFDMEFSHDGRYIYATAYTFPKALHRWRVDGAAGAPIIDYEGDFTYEVRDGEAVITGYRGESRNIVIPSSIDGYTVTAIGENAFLFFGNYVRNITLTLPDTLKRIESRAFLNMWSLKKIALPERLQYIGSEAFLGCKNLYEITIPSSVKTVEANAFNTCHGLRKVVIGGGLKTVPAEMFGRCRGIREVVFLDGVEKVKANVFGISKLEKVTFPETLTECDAAAFEGDSVSVYGKKGSYAETFCAGNDRCVFVEMLRGDVDGDGKITVADALLILRISIRLDSCDVDTAGRIDMDEDGETTVSDALLALRAVAAI